MIFWVAKKASQSTPKTPQNLFFINPPVPSGDHSPPLRLPSYLISTLVIRKNVHRQGAFRHPPPQLGVLDHVRTWSVPGVVYPPLPSRRPCTFRRPHSLSAIRDPFLCFFLFVRILVENLDGPKLLFWSNLLFWGPPQVSF